MMKYLCIDIYSPHEDPKMSQPEELEIGVCFTGSWWEATLILFI